MATIVSIDAHNGELQRYEIGGSAYRLTHACTFGEPVTFNAKTVEQFRLMPDARFAVEPPPRPTNPSANAGTARIAA